MSEMIQSNVQLADVLFNSSPFYVQSQYFFGVATQLVEYSFIKRNTPMNALNHISYGTLSMKLLPIPNDGKEIVVYNDFTLYQNSCNTATFEFTTVHQMIKKNPISFVARLNYNSFGLPVWKIRDFKENLLQCMTLSCGQNTGINPTMIFANHMEVEFSPIIQPIDNKYIWVMLLRGTTWFFTFAETKAYFHHSNMILSSATPKAETTNNISPVVFTISNPLKPKDDTI